jgi:predicted Zn-dependent protease with MMP-like domain
MNREGFVKVAQETLDSHRTLIHELGHYFGMTEEQLKDV